jgi:hypothetical protein
MKYLKKYIKLFEGVGDKLPEDDIFLVLLKDLSLEISDIGFNVTVRGYESYTRGLITYDIIINSKEVIEVYDIDSSNINEMDKIDDTINKSSKLNDICKEIITISIEKGLYLCNYNLSMRISFIRFTCKLDGSPVDSDYKYNNDRY